MSNGTALRNTIDGKLQAHREAQEHRLRTSHEGRNILHALGYDVQNLPTPTPTPAGHGRFPHGADPNKHPS
ncbi:hypothetical protein IscW_ISCW006056 [Ixodes scapularis]|uniref:Uncharacterized protein n=1 Tax=Ixodes scapularis TaxID=6945 RepID=B7PNF3_IXOSC|nr:hypothetical protein IscW_ISCW006056 [Ixodes scapularis]|eukprot:XP_002435301.1 hypothetical protein IscW_ISCW006056 [Ixodes scapularis]